jgi:uncharacterized protein (DUF983 family)
MTATVVQPLGEVISRALCERCPHCGIGKLFTSYLKPVTECSACHTSFAGIRADDGPAWLTILVVGHLIVPSLVYVLSHYEWPIWFSIPFWFTLTIVLALAILPRAKALFIAMIWRTRAKG